MQNWRTTFSGLAVGICTFIVTNPDMFDGSDWQLEKPLSVRVASWILAGGLSAIGIFAKDA